MQVFFKDGTYTHNTLVEYPLGHRRRRSEAIPLLEQKFRTNLATRFPAQRVNQIIALCNNQQKLENTPVNQFMDLFVI